MKLRWMFVSLALLSLGVAALWSALAAAPWEREVWDGCWKATQQWSSVTRSVSGDREARLASSLIIKAQSQVLSACYGAATGTAPAPPTRTPVQGFYGR